MELLPDESGDVIRRNCLPFACMYVHVLYQSILVSGRSGFILEYGVHLITEGKGVRKMFQRVSDLAFVWGVPPHCRGMMVDGREG